MYLFSSQHFFAFIYLFLFYFLFFFLFHLFILIYSIFFIFISLFLSFFTIQAAILQSITLYLNHFSVSFFYVTEGLVQPIVVQKKDPLKCKHSIGSFHIFDSQITAYLFENCGARRAPLRPYFFLSFILGSLVRNPAFLRIGL